jgi:hypothetical protein
MPIISRRSSAKSKVWKRLVNVLGAVIVTLSIMWELGLTSPEWWERFRAPNISTAAWVPTRSPKKAIGITPALPKGNDSSISPVTLRLMLVHASPGTTPFQGSAKIGVVRETPQTYVAGALLENGARLAEIHENYVLLTKSGRSARLYIEGVAHSAEIGDVSATLVGLPQTAPPALPKASRELLTDYIRPNPIYDGQSLVGYELYPGANSGPFNQMGLRPGDVIVKLQGIQLNDPTASWEVLRQLAAGEVLEAEVRRGGSLESLHLDGSLITHAEELKSHWVAGIANTTGP